MGDSIQVTMESVNYNEQFAQLATQINETNKFLYATVDRIDFLISLVLAVVISAVVYAIIKAFTRF